MKRITVFCGSSPGHDPVWMETAFLLGSHLAANGIGLVYGGAKVGMMGAVADGALSAGGSVTGVLPRFLKDKEIAHDGLSELVLVGTMHERKIRMHELSDGVIALPGGFGTLEEYFEMLTWGQLGLHQKPVGLLNANGFYDDLLRFADKMAASGLLKPSNRAMMLSNSSVSGILADMSAYQPPSTGKWLDRGEI